MTTTIDVPPRAPRRSPAKPCPVCGQVHHILGAASTWDASFVDDRWTTATAFPAKGGGR